MEQSTLQKYFKGNTSPDEEKVILDWVEISEENWKIFQNERLLFDTALFINPEKISQKKAYRHFTPILKWSGRVAAMLAIVFSCMHLSSEYIYNHNAIKQTITAPAGQRAQIILADGTTIWLNSKSTLVYNTNFGKNERNVELDGEAFFEVAKNKKVPFYVHTEKNKIKVVGTTFNVCAYKNSNEFQASLIEGSVEVYPVDSKKLLARLEKNQTLSIKNEKVVKAGTKSTEFLKWKDGLYCFDDSPFQSILNKLEIYYGVKIIVENPEILNYQCTGKFNEKDGVEHILKVIQRDHNFTYSIKQDEKTITIR